MKITAVELLIAFTGLLGQFYVGKLNRLGLVLWTLSNVMAIALHTQTGLQGLLLLHTAYLSLTLKDLVAWTKKGLPLSFKLKPAGQETER